MGTPKALVDDPAGGSFVERGVRVLRAGGCSPVVVVVGAEAARATELATAAGAADEGNPDGGKANDRYRTAGRAIIASIHREDRIPGVTIGSHVIKEGFQPGPGGPDIAITELQC